jgi:hypothetical protein
MYNHHHKIQIGMTDHTVMRVGRVQDATGRRPHTSPRGGPPFTTMAASESPRNCSINAFSALNDSKSVRCGCAGREGKWQDNGKGVGHHVGVRTQR